MTALDIILRLIQPGDVVLAGTDIYGGTDRLLTFLKTQGGAEVRHLDLDVRDDLEAVLQDVGKRCKMVLVESPTNPLLKIADLRMISSLVHAASPEALVVVDNTMMSPYLQRPLNLGADIVYDSGTKYLSGHHDVMAGIIAVERDEVAKRVAFLINSTGTGLAPQDCFLLLRGLKTLSIRMDRQCATAHLVALYLDTLGFHVNFPGLASHPDRDVHYGQADGAGAVLSFTTGDVGASERIVGGTRLWGISVSFGCVNSLISMPCVMSWV
jgi:cystathionine beta-lyase/cystathionine gamma-synthase